ncbi:lysylphosphatidylglycerol synthase transmembrane domain-containing protein [Flavihumibacter petaseus]|uniref:Flippase-like domain-containing protein n=1 Tax=Flavihumibacter petaseus NBRC 106054 TaxID=1220578 RepID=A0A0E9N3D7_9BACT|nr:lysylphosphatidylglycerol synthase transmembrane domain-containing protein [Flavihumibacter petaseus]GAO44477.1 hypothetical protein FPE01S_03_05140 [Flavihumibacter petaseus NBRC 106054]
MDKKKITSALQYVFFLALGIFLVWWSIGKIDHQQWVEMKAAMRRTNYNLLIPVVIALLISHYSRAVRWKILMEPMGYRPDNLRVYLLVLIGYLSNLLVPRLGEVLKCTLLARYEKIPADKLIGTIVAERAFDMICLLLVFFITLISQLDVIGTFAREKFSTVLANGGREPNILYLLAIAAFVAVVIFLGIWLFRRFRHNNVMVKIIRILQGVWEGLNSVRYVKKKGWFFFHTILIWFLYLASIRLGFLAMQETKPLGWPPAFSVLSMGSIGMIATQGGIGAYPVLVQETMMLYGIHENVGKAFGWILWLAQTLLILVAGGIASVLLPRLKRNAVKTA